MARTLCSLALVCSSILGQSNAFEVASVKLAAAGFRGSDGGPGTKNPERYSFYGARLSDLIFEAYGLFDSEQISGPSWIYTETYDVIAKVPVGSTKTQFQQMFQQLLAERFSMQVHHETKSFPVYEIVVGKNGPKLGRGAKGKEGFPELPPGRPAIAMTNRPDRLQLAAQQEPISVLATMLKGTLRRPVNDKTSLTGSYDFTLEFNPRVALEVVPTNVSSSLVPNIFIAFEEQLGLKLVDSKAPFDVIVVDSAKKVPTQN